MSFDALLSLLAVIFFIVLPLISNAGKRKTQGKPKPPPGPAQSPEPPAAGEPPPGWLARLEEARQRVEAELEAANPTTQASTPTARPAPAAQRPPPPRPVPAAVPVTRQAPVDRTPAAPRVRQQPAARREHSPAFMPASDDLQVTRLGTRPAYNDGRSAQTASALTSRSSVLNGIIWHQILSEPLYMQRTGRKTSRLRSP